jgi:hypothetical protein
MDNFLFLVTRDPMIGVQFLAVVATFFHLLFLLLRSEGGGSSLLSLRVSGSQWGAVRNQMALSPVVQGQSRYQLRGDLRDRFDVGALLPLTKPSVESQG